MPPGTHKDALLNDFAIRSFRDTADRDYVHARLAFRAHLIPQFQWSALHCLEKYAKCILVLNRIPAKHLRHEVSGSLRELERKGKFKVALSPESLELIKRLENGAEFRYFEVSYVGHAFDVVRLDLAVSEIRRYCAVLDWTIRTPAGEEHNLLRSSLARIEVATRERSKDTCIMSGWLETIMKKRDHPAREALLWNNLYFGPSTRKKVRMVGYEEGGNAPLYLHPELIDDVLKFVYMPKSVAEMWREHLSSVKRAQ